MYQGVGTGGFFNQASAQSSRDFFDLSGAKKTAAMSTILNPNRAGGQGSAASIFANQTQPTNAAANAFGPEIFKNAFTGTATPQQSAALRTYYNPSLWNSFSGTDEFASGGLGGAGGGGGGLGGGGNLSGTTLNFDTLGKERLSAQNNLDMGILSQQGRQTSLDKLLPLLGSAFGSMSGGGSLGGQQPAINAGPIYTPQQIQQQVNRGVAGNDAQFAGLLRSLAGRFGGAGFSQNSPLLAALMQQAGAQNIAANTNVRTQLPFDIASGNASHLLQSQAAAENQFSNRQQEQLAAQRNAVAMLSSVLGIV